MKPIPKLACKLALVGANPDVAVAAFRHGEALGSELGAAQAVFVGNLRLGSAERRGDGVLEPFVFHEVGRAIQAAHARDQLRMQSGESQHGGSTHRPADEKNPPDFVPLPQFSDDLHDVGLGLWTHP